MSIHVGIGQRISGIEFLEATKDVQYFNNTLPASRYQWPCKSQGMTWRCAVLLEMCDRAVLLEMYDRNISYHI